MVPIFPFHLIINVKLQHQFCLTYTTSSSLSQKPNYHCMPLSLYPQGISLYTNIYFNYIGSVQFRFLIFHSINYLSIPTCIHTPRTSSRTTKPTVPQAPLPRPWNHVSKPSVIPTNTIHIFLAHFRFKLQTNATPKTHEPSTYREANIEVSFVKASSWKLKYPNQWPLFLIGSKWVRSMHINVDSLFGGCKCITSTAWVWCTLFICCYLDLTPHKAIRCHRCFLARSSFFKMTTYFQLMLIDLISVHNLQSLINNFAF